MVTRKNILATNDTCRKRKLEREKQAQRELAAPLGCRHVHPGSGCRCGKAVAGNAALCAEHKEDIQPQLIGFGSTSFLMGRRSGGGLGDYK
jgi:hypothetical protein